MSGRCFALLALSATAGATLRGNSAMQPDVVAHLLGSVDKNWEQSALAALTGKETEAKALEAMQQSCQKVSRSIIDGSEGDKDRVTEYMSAVCAASTGEEAQVCAEFSARIGATMTHDAYHNREELDLAAFCDAFYQGSVMERAKKEHKAQEAVAAEKKKAEEEKAREEEMKKHLAKATERHNEVLNAEKEVKEGDAAIKDADATTAAIEKDGQAVKNLVEKAQKEVQAADEKVANEAVAAAEAQAKKAAAEAEEKRAQVAARKAAEEAKKKAAEQKRIEEEKAKADKASTSAKKEAEEKPAKTPAEPKATKKSVAALATKVSHCPPCGSLVCPHGFTAEETEGHCCPYCVNPAISTAVVKDPAYYAEKAAPIYKKFR